MEEKNINELNENEDIVEEIGENEGEKEPNKKEPEKTNFLVDLLKNLIVSVILVVIILNFIAIPVRVDGSSMYPNLHDGDFGFAAVFTKWLNINRFDVVVIDSPKTENNLVKRVIGLPNETIKFENNILYVNGEEVAQDFLSDEVITDDFEVSLGDDEYFCLGDNREVSRDSRYYGPFNKSDFIAVGVLTLWPISDFGID